MAKKSVIARNKKRIKKVLNNFKAQEELRRIVKKTDDEDERIKALNKLHNRRRSRPYRQTWRARRSAHLR